MNQKLRCMKSAMRKIKNDVMVDVDGVATLGLKSEDISELVITELIPSEEGSQSKILG